MPATPEPAKASRSPWIRIGIAAAIFAVGAVGIGAYFSSQFPANDSDFNLHLWVKDKPAAAGNFAWTENIINSGSSTALDALAQCPSSSTEVFAFLSVLGQERKGVLYWQAYSRSSFVPGGTSVLEANLKPSGLISGQPGPRYLHQVGGKFSLGLACTHGNGGIVDSVGFRHVVITPNSDIQILER